MLKTPVVLFIYKRSSNLEAITKILRQIKPICVYIIADGPKLGDEVECQKTRRRLLDLIDWPCKIHKNYTKNNLGLKDRFRTGIDWVFKHEQRAIFIEDDCIPDPTFFKFCDELLEKYKDDQRMMTISGNNFQFGQKKSSDSYYFSRYPHIWGWATWRRTWMHYDGNIIDWPARRSTNWLKEATHGFIIAKFWKYIFDRLYTDKINTWDYQLTYASLKHHGLNIIPSVNLVSNVGYGAGSTNIKRQNQTIAVPTTAMQFPLVHPRRFIADLVADRRIDDLVYLSPLGRISLFIKSILGIL